MIKVIQVSDRHRYICKWNGDALEWDLYPLKRPSQYITSYRDTSLNDHLTAGDWKEIPIKPIRRRLPL